MADKVSKENASESQAADATHPQVDGERDGASIFNPLDYGPDEAYSKVYDCTGERRIWIGDLPGVPTQEHMEACLPPGRYILMIRAGESCPVEGKTKGTLIHPNYAIVVPGERTNAPTTVSRAMEAGGVATSGRVQGATNVPEAIPPPPVSSPSADNVPTALVDLIARLVADRPVQPPVGKIKATTELIDLLIKVKTLQNDPQEVTITDIRGAFEEGEKLGDAKGYARGCAEHGNGDGSGGPDLLTVLGKVLESPVVQDMIKRASAPAVSLESLQAGVRQATREGPSNGETDD